MGFHYGLKLRLCGLKKFAQKCLKNTNNGKNIRPDCKIKERYYPLYSRFKLKSERLFATGFFLRATFFGHFVKPYKILLTLFILSVILLGK
jgi:hypothetical protein